MPLLYLHVSNLPNKYFKAYHVSSLVGRIIFMDFFFFYIAIDIMFLVDIKYH